MISPQEALRHLDDVIGHYESVSGSKKSKLDPSSVEYQELFLRLRTAVLGLAPKGSEYEARARDWNRHNKSDAGWGVPTFLAIARSLRRDFAAGFAAASFEALVRVDLFGDFLDMARHLLDSGFKDPAAVLIGAVLETHLRKLCEKHGVPTADKGKSRKADSLNSDLASKAVYTRLDQKSVTAWQALRNNAAHGTFSAYSEAQVDLMLGGVRDFVSRTPA